MRRPRFEMAEVIQQFLPTLKKSGQLLSHHKNTLQLLRDCRTARMGGHLDACDACGNIRISYNSCRNRHCPKCQGLKKEMWLIQQEDMLLPVAYFHVVFTLPHQLNQLCLHQPQFLYNCLFQSAWFTLKTLAKDDRWLGAQTAATMLLHTWSQTLVLHPHLHCIVPHGGCTREGKWKFPHRSKGNFLFPVKAMQKVFKGRFMKLLKKGIESGELPLPPGFPTGYRYKKWKDALYEKNWVVYTKKPFSHVKNVVNYLGRYSHRVALTNHRIRSIADGKVSFTYKDYKDRAKKKTMTLAGEEFLRRFCLHILPKGFRKIRQYGFLSNASKAQKIPLIRRAFGEKKRQLLDRKARKKLAQQRLFGQNPHQCPCCQQGKMVVLSQWQRNKSPPTWVLPLIRQNQI